MHEVVAAAAPQAEEPLDPQAAAACLAAERLAREIVLAAQEEADRLLADARERATALEAALLEQAEAALEGVELPPPGDRHLDRLASTAGSRSEAILQRAIERAARLRETAEAEAAAIETETRQRRKAVERELVALEGERDDLVRVLEARVASVLAASKVAVERPARRSRLRTLALAAVVVAVAALAGVAGWEIANSQAASPPVVQTPPAQPSLPAGSCPIPNRYRSVFVSAARRTQLPLSLLTAVATVESRWNPHASSGKGAVGLMQLLPSTAAALHVNPYGVRENVVGGARYLRQLLSRFGGDTRLALAAYEAGPTRVSQGSVPLETVLYVGAVMARQASIVGCR